MVARKRRLSPPSARDRAGSPTLLALLVTPAAQGDRAQGEALAQDMQQVTGGTVEMAYFAQAVLVRNLRLSQRRTGSS
jgi:hypothetical protein